MSTNHCEHEPKHAKGLCKKCYDAVRPPQVRNHARLKETNAAYYLANRKKKLAQCATWAKTHPKNRYAIYVKWVRAHPEAWLEIARARNRRRRARKLGNTVHFTSAEWTTLKRQYGFRCVGDGCWKTEAELKVLGRKLVPDHIVPLNRGGLDCIENIQPLCHGRGGCNNKKGRKTIDFVIS